MESGPQTEYAAFEEKVKRTVYLDNLSPLVTEAVIRTALNQFGSVVGVSFLPNYIDMKGVPRCALVEMENLSQAKSIISEMANYPFMMTGMPRPVRARAAEVEMFDDRPIKPGRKIECRWLDPNEPEFKVASKLKNLTKKHTAEAAFLLKKQLEEEAKLAKQQAEALQVNNKKFETIESVLRDGLANRLARHYGMKINTRD